MANANMYPLADLSSKPDLLESRVRVNPDTIARELRDITDAIAPVMGDTMDQEGYGLQSIAITLTVGAEGGLAFVAKGSAEASITVTIARPTS